MCFNLSDLKCYESNVMKVLLQVLEIIFKVQRKMSNEKIIRREINFPTYNTCFFFFRPLLLLNLITFLFYSFLKRYRNVIWSFTNYLWTLTTTKQHIKNFVGVWEPDFVTFGGLFFEFLILLFWGPRTFSILFHFLRFLVH
jgi:hypothetical protein